MDSPRIPTGKQEELAALPLTNILVIAPAGCGKTEALALRAAAICARGEVRPPRKVLALTFSNKAKQNLATRVRSIMGPAWWRKVDVTNFHGLAGRLLRAHGDNIGLPQEVVFPERAWLARTKRQLGIDWKSGPEFEAALQQAKRGPLSDDEVMERLESSGNRSAVMFEKRLREESRLDHDDLLRHASRLLAIPEVRRLYEAHFGLVMVDEVQDLTMIQFGIAQAIGADRITYAGDPAQGIYSFAGAEPEAVFAAIEGLGPVIVELDESYRSSPAVLEAVNILAAQLGSTRLECGDPDQFPDRGHVVLVKRDSPEDEADALLPLLQEILETYRGASIGVIVRRSTRADVLREALASAKLSHEDWSVPTHVPRVAALLRRFVREAVGSSDDRDEQLETLELLCRMQLESSDASGLDEVSLACEDLLGLVSGGMSVLEAVEMCRETPVGAGNLVRAAHQDFRTAGPDGEDEVWRSPLCIWPSFVCSSWSGSHGAIRRTWPSRLSCCATRLPFCAAK
jgi:DNA helicase II / ATP-dependent DNA helicase PcrA